MLVCARVMARASLLVGLVLLAGCDQAPAPAPQNSSTPAEHGYIARVQALPPGQREGVLFRAIQGGGGSACQGVKQVDTMAPLPSGQPAWRVTCIEGSQWRVALADDGTAYVTGARP